MKIHQRLSSLILKIFEKKGIETIEDLEPEERVEYDRWQAIIDGPEITMEKLREFCGAQVEAIEKRFEDPDNTEKRDSFLKASIHIYKTLIKLIDAPEVERQNLERHLTNLINQ